MAIYVKRESAVEDAIQTPGKVGNDLDQIEKAVAGPDGINAHEEEIEDAIEGMIDEPANGLMTGAEITEALYMNLYESEYNFNQILECLDMHSLYAESVGRTLVLEAVDIKGFFTTVKNAILEAFHKFTELINGLINKVKALFQDNSKFAKNNAAAITAGFAKMSIYNEEVIGYAYDHKDLEYIASALNNVANDDSYDLDQDTIDIARNKGKIYSGDADNLENEMQGLLIDFAKAFSLNKNNDNISSVGDLVRDMEEFIRGKDKIDIRKYYKSADEVINILKSDTASDITNNYNNIKKSISKKISELDKKAAELSDNNKDNANNADISGYKFAAQYCKLYQQAVQSICVTVCKLRTEELMQARKFANLCIKISGNKLTHESATISSNGSFINNIKFI